jgi:phosphatidylserine decarboxylase
MAYPVQPIIYHDRYRNARLTEKVYGEAWLRRVYGNPLGRLALWAVVCRPLFSRWYGWRMRSPASKARIAPFIREFEIDPAEFACAPHAFESFNDFFMRRLKPDARPMDDRPDAIIFPADGRHLALADIAAGTRVFVKGQQWDVARLVGDRDLAARYTHGSLVLSRLCPVDYHHFHFAVGGTPGPARRLRGPLYSVNPIALRQRLDYMWRNDRRVTEIQTAHLGTVLQIEVGATNVGTIRQDYVAGEPVAKGMRKGWFEFGGSSVITLFEPGTVRLADDLLACSAEGIELYARMGDTMATRAARP